MISRSPSAIMKKKLTTYSGLPANFLRSSGSCVAMPTGQVFRWHLRIMMQPIVTSAAVAMPHSSAPSSVAMATSRGRAKLPVGLHDDPPAQVVHHQHLVRLGQAQLPGDAGVLDRRLRAGAGAAVVPADQHDVALALADAGGDGAHADFGHELDADPRLAIGVLQVVDQLRQVFDRVDVVVRRRRDQAHARRAVADAGDFLVDLVAGQLAAFAGLGALGHLDLQLLGADQVFAGDAEAAAGHLLDGADCAGRRWRRGRSGPGPRPLRPCCSCRPCGSWRWPSVSCASLRDRAVRHRAGGESLDDRRGGLDLFQGHRRVRRA